LLVAINNSKCVGKIFYEKGGTTKERMVEFICIECFKRCMYGDETGQPIFPYPHIENEYDENPENPKWKNDYPLIEIYQRDYNNWEDKKNEKYENETNIRLCPVCRS
jgi:hypothetical protein